LLATAEDGGQALLWAQLFVALATAGGGAEARIDLMSGGEGAID
jgi:hypothetical protein